MSACNIQITTTADGVETRFSQRGVWTALSAVEIRLEYEEEQARVQIVIGENGVQIHRLGDYTLDLTLKQGETLRGSLGIGGASGEVFTKTERLEYLLKENSALLLASYDLIVSGEIQKMKIRLKAEQI